MSKIVNKEAIPKQKDVVIDFGDLSFLYSPEIGIIASLAKDLKRVERKIIVIATNSVEELFEKTAMHLISNLLFGLRHVTAYTNKPKVTYMFFLVGKGGINEVYFKKIIL